MPTNQTERPKFYEEQYLGASDLTAALEYGRIQQARHALGAHTWGIAMGLQLKETPQPGGTVAVYLLPGYAWDGYGRPIVVLAPYRIPEELFSAITFNPGVDTDGKGRLIPVWLRYDELSARNPPPGFEVCEVADQHSRVLETFRVEIGERSAPSDRYTGISLAGKTLADASAALQVFDPAAPPVFDESVPDQAFPETPAKAKWLIPVGYVRWLPVQNQAGHFVARDDSGTGGAEKDSDKIRRVRRYIGVVTETVEAADGRIRLKNRGHAPSTVQASGDLVWIEGDLRMEGDVHLFGHKLDFRDALGTDNGGRPLFMQRVDDPGKSSSLEVVVGASNQGLNTFSIGPLAGGKFDAKVTVRDDGRMGIGTTSPDRLLTIQGSAGAYLNVKGDGGLHEVLIGADGAGGIVSTMTNHDLQLRAGGNATRMIIKADGNVGIGTTVPDRTLTIEGSSGTYLNVKGDGGGHEVLLGADANGGIVSTMTNHDLQLRAGINSTKMIVKADGKVGIGTLTPGFQLDVADRMRIRQGASGTAGTWLFQTGPNSDRAFIGMAGDSRVGFWGNTGAQWGLTMDTSTANVGIGTLGAVCRLHVVDSKSGDAGNPDSHVSVIENLDAGGNGDVLALKIGANLATQSNNFITFFAGGNAIAAVEGNNFGGVSFSSMGADFAECLPRINPGELIEEGDIVGIFGGRVSKVTQGAPHVTATTRRPIVVGSAPNGKEKHLYEQVTFLGQVPVKVSGPVREGDYIVPSGLNDGIGRAISADSSSLDRAQVVGRAWQSDFSDGVKLVNVVIGLSNGAPDSGLLLELHRQESEITALKAELGALKELIAGSVAGSRMA